MVRYPNPSVLGCVIGAILLFCSPALRAATENPFEQAVQQSYMGRFSGPEVDLRILRADGEKWTGTLVFHGKSYDLDARKGASGLEGTFAEGAKSWPFTVVVEGDTLSFTTESVTTKLQRRKLPKLEGRWRSERVLVIFGASTNGTTGQIQFNGQEYTFEVQEKAGDLEGMFKAGDKLFPFSVANEVRGLVFRTGSFSEVLSQVVNTGVVAQPEPAFVNLNQSWTNSLGMLLVPVPGTKVLFAIWETRVQDYQAYEEANSGVDAQWKNPGFEQGPTHPVTMVSWDDAKAFCEWLTKKERGEGKISKSQSYRLPTDAEWSVAVGLDEPQGRTPKDKDEKIQGIYPWGTQWPPPNDAGNYDDYSSSKISGFQDGFQRTAPVGGFKANRSGIYDLGGNVWEWCEDWYNGEQDFRVMRGASWVDVNPEYLLSSYRNVSSPEGRHLKFGFRCVLVGEASP